MSCATKKTFPRTFHLGGVKSFVLPVLSRVPVAFLTPKRGTFHVKGEKLGERFFAVKYIK